MYIKIGNWEIGMQIKVNYSLEETKGLQWEVTVGNYYSLAAVVILFLV
jgi:hypothetical protein